MTINLGGGQLLIWDTDEFEAESTIAIDFVIGIKGVWKKSGSKVNILNIHGPHDDHNKQRLWASLVSLLCSNKDEAWLICGDFNEVRCPSERLNCDFISNRALWFNDFIEQCHLVEIPLSGRIFTRVSEDGIKFSKLDRFLVCEKFMNIWQNLSATALERKHSDHCPIMLKDDEKNFGPKPFKLFDAWLDEDGVDQIIKNAWDIKPSGNRLDCVFRNKLKNVKEALKSWSKTKFSSLDNEIEALKIATQEMETNAELGQLVSSEIVKWQNTRKEWLQKKGTKTKMLKQKARVRWILEGDENSKFFHSVIKRKNSRNNIRGISFNGLWVDEP
ncbi:uncharacterized protein [Rutidosis leptorrhynchoides]|uniref:uncharacterized protein n=1 Tax=Rutidosis leptorrhynchoides TaxID=125765 RepID=UPI003A99315B